MGKGHSPKFLNTFKELTTRFAKLRPKPQFTFSEVVEHWQKLAGMCVAGGQPLAQLLGAEARPLLAQLLNDTNSQVRSETVAVLMRLNTATAHEILKNHMTHEAHLPLSANIAKHLIHLGVLLSSE